MLANTLLTVHDFIAAWFIAKNKRKGKIPISGEDIGERLELAVDT